MGFLGRVQENLAAADWRVFSFMILNFASSTGIVLSNKYVMDKLEFRFATTLTLIHFTMTFLCLILVSLCGVFQIKKLPWGPTAKLAAGSMGFVVLTNLSLQHNSVGFYQMMKVMTTPVVVLIESLIYRKYLETNLKVALIPVCVGVLLTTSTDYRLNFLGTVFGVSGVLVTSFYQIWSGTLQKSLECDALQLQFFTAPLSAIFIIPFVPLFDDWNPRSPSSIWTYNFTYENMSMILATGCIAFLVNISIFLVIGKSSALTYNILGHAKTSFILLSDFALFGRPAEPKGISGILCALFGVFWYTHLKLEKNRLEKEAKSKVPSNNEEVVELIEESDESNSSRANSKSG